VKSTMTTMTRQLSSSSEREEIEHLKELCKQIYAQHAPEGIDSVDNLFRQIDGSKLERELYLKICEKHTVTPDPQFMPSRCQANKQELQRLQHQQSKKVEQQMVNDFLELHGFHGVNAQKKNFIGKTTKFPLHEAVKKNNPHLVRLLLRAGATPNNRNSCGQMPIELAKSLNKDGRFDEILGAFHSHTSSSS